MLPLVDIWMAFLLMFAGVTVVCPSLRTATGTGVPGVVLCVVVIMAAVGVEGVLSDTSVFTGRTITLSRWYLLLCVDRDHFVLNIALHITQLYETLCSPCLASLCRFIAFIEQNCRWHSEQVCSCLLSDEWETEMIQIKSTILCYSSDIIHTIQPFKDGNILKMSKTIYLISKL